MKRNLSLIVLLVYSIQVVGQSKPLIDTGMLASWPYIMASEKSITLSQDGHYVAYVIYNRKTGIDTLVLQDLRGAWKEAIVGIQMRLCFFTADSRQLCWQRGDSVWLQEVGNKKRRRFLGISSDVSCPKDYQGEWIILSGIAEGDFRLINLITGNEKRLSGLKSYRWLTGGRQLIYLTTSGNLKCLNWATGREFSFSGIKDYALSPDEKIMVMVMGERDYLSLQWMKLGEGKPVKIWIGQLGEQPEGFIYDKEEHQLAFNVQSKDGGVSIWHYQEGQPMALLKLKDEMTGLAQDLQVSGVKSFSSNGRWLLFYVYKRLPLLPKESTVAPVDIWSYRDEVLHPAQRREGSTFHNYTAVMELRAGQVRLLEQKDDERAGQTLGDYVWLETGVNEAGQWWPHGGIRSFWLVSLVDGKRRLIKKLSDGWQGGISIFTSPRSRWIIYWDQESGHYYSLEPSSGKSINLTAGLPETVVDDVEQEVLPLPVGIAGWCSQDSAVLLYDNYDVWKLDPAGRKAPVNVTGAYGKLHGVKLRFVYNIGNNVRTSDELLLNGYDVTTKYNGFLTVRPDKPGSVQLLTMGPYTYYQTAVTKLIFSNSMSPLFAGVGKYKRWIVMRESAIEYPNYYVSKDLKEFIPLTHLEPNKTYNWLTAEPVNWRMYNGQRNSGVLYKPENFDSAQKYPVIFNYYEKRSHRCFQFPMPELTIANINIPWFVSRGYLVFTPDIQYSVASRPGGMTTGEAAYNTMASAAEYLSQLSFVDKGRLGLQGHSFGGGQTLGIITHSGLFAAAAEMAGGTDNISSYLTLVSSNDRNNLEERYDKQDHPQGRMGATPWERPDLYRRNSPVLNADKITTPLMIVHNKKDGAINFRQGVEMYMALRRLGKPCWLLQYDNSGHGLVGTDALDYTIRLTQYFDHYLKGKAAPEWMTRNMLAAYKGKNNLYALDSMGSCFNACAVCQVWNKRRSGLND